MYVISIYKYIYIYIYNIYITGEKPLLSKNTFYFKHHKLKKKTFLEELHQTLARFNAHGKWEARDVKRGDEARHGPPHYQQAEEPQNRPHVARHDVTIS